VGQAPHQAAIANPCAFQPGPIIQTAPRGDEVGKAGEFSPGELTYGSDNEVACACASSCCSWPERCQDDQGIRRHQAQQILFYCDFFAFAKAQQADLQASAQQAVYGPVPTGAENAGEWEQDGDVFADLGGYGPAGSSA